MYILVVVCVTLTPVKNLEAVVTQGAGALG